MVSILNRLLWRELWHLRGQVFATALVVACGVATLIGTRGTYESLLAEQARCYRVQRFADVFAHLKRAPLSLVAEIRQIPGVARVEARVVMDVTLDVAGLAEPAVGRIVSIPERGMASLNALQVMRGRQVDRGADDEVLVSQAFADANRLMPGDHLGAILHGRWKRLTVVGVALSPEYVYEIGSGMLFPDNRRFGVLWMAQAAVAPAFDMDGAFNDVALAVERGASEATIIDALDRLLASYGGLNAYGRGEQQSNRFLTDEFGEIGIMTAFIPGLFLGVAAFLLYAVMTRLVSMQRTQIGLLKAFGRSDLRVAGHFLSMAMCIAALGWLAGVPLGLSLGNLFIDAYRAYFHFPRLEFAAGPQLLLVTLGASMAAAGVGALSAASRAARLDPAEAMRPEPPATFRPSPLDRMAAALRWRASLRMILRNLARQPWKAGMSAVGIALAIGLMVVGRFTMDAANHLMGVHFGQVQRDDATVLFAESRSAGVTLDIRKLPGVLQAEPFRSVPVRLRFEHRSKRVELLGLSAGHQLRRMIDTRGAEVAASANGLVLTAKLAEILGVGRGERVTVEVLEGRRTVVEVPVVDLVDEMLGLGAYMDAGGLARLLDEEPATSSGAYLRLDATRAANVYALLKLTPAVAGVSVREATLQSVRSALDRSFLFFSVVLTVLAGVVVAGMVYNSLRIALSERGHELASLAVLGFTQREVAALLFGEQAIILLVALPCGLAIGYGLCAALVPVFDRELFRLPLVVGRWSLVYPVIAAAMAAAGAGALVAGRLRKLDLVAVLKTRE
jgi:putative ABC transport system permease protein